MNTIKQKTISELTIKNSKFITILYPINKKEEVGNLLLECQKNYPKATHYCYAYITTDHKKTCDDKEPTGTAGLPILNVLEKEQMQNVLAVVIRYFGGIKLGAGGLIRAYSKSIKQALMLATKIALIKAFKCELHLPYEQEKKYTPLLQTTEIITATYLEEIIYIILIPDQHPLLNMPNLKILESTYMKKTD